MAVICRICKEIKELHEFVKHNQHKNGYDTKCKKCHAYYNKKYVISRRKENQKPKEKIIVDKKYCRECFVEKDISNFVKCFSSPDGHRNKCSDCQKSKYHLIREERFRFRSNNNKVLICFSCKTNKCISKFNAGGIKRKNPICKTCEKIINDKIKDNTSVSTQCIINRIDFDELLLKQNNVCAICFKPESRTIKGTLSKLCVDHCHKTGAIRGLLCTKCNSGIGLLQDSPVILEQALSYLKKND